MEKYKSNRVPEYAGYGGVPEYEAYGRLKGGIPVEEYYSRYRNNNEEDEDEEKSPDFSYLANTPVHMGLTAATGQTPMKSFNENLVKNREIVDTPFSQSVLENDCYNSERFEPFMRETRWNEGENQGIIYATPETTGTDQPTKYGISQNLLDLYRNKYKELFTIYPSDVKDLTEEQAENLYCQIYKGSRAEAINDPNLAFAVFDSNFIHPSNSTKAWQRAMNKVYQSGIQVDGVVGSELINNFNKIDEKEGDRQRLYNEYERNRLRQIKEEDKKGISNRIKRYR